MTINILSGKFKGKKLFLPSKNTTRAGKAILRSSFFNTIRDHLNDKNFIEAFAGSGVMACEALSNGSKTAFAIEKDKIAFEILKKNLNFDENLKPIYGDSFVILKSVIDKINNKAIIYLDPPFDYRDGFSGIYEKLIKLIENLDKNKIFMIVFEHNSDKDIVLKSYVKIKHKKFGKSSLSYFEPLNFME